MVPPPAEECEAKVSRIFERIRKVPNKDMDNYVLLPRDVLLYSWILQKREGTVPLHKLFRLVGGSLKQGITVYVKTEMFLQGHTTKMEDDFFVLTKEMMTGIETAFNNTYSLKKLIPYFPERINGLQLVELFAGIIPESQFATPLPRMVPAAFAAALEDVEVRLISNQTQTYHVSKSGLWNFVMCATATEGAININHLNQWALDLVNARGDQTTWPALLFATNSDDIEVARRANLVSRFHHVWSISAVRFFNGLKDLIDQYGAQRVTENFAAIFPEEPADVEDEKKETFSGGDAIHNLEAALQNP